MKKKENLEKICEYAELRKEKFQMTKICYDCKIKEQIICFEPYSKNCYYYETRDERTYYMPGKCTIKDKYYPGRCVK